MGERAPPEVREAYKHDPVYCNACEQPVSATVADDVQPLRWECPCSIGYLTGTLPDEWYLPEPANE